MLTPEELQVENTPAPKSITGFQFTCFTGTTVRILTQIEPVEDSFKRCTTWDAVALILKVLAPDLLTRVHEDAMLHRYEALS